MSKARNNPAFGNTGSNSTQIHSHLEIKLLRSELADFLDEMTEENFDGEELDRLLAALEEADPAPEFTSNEESLAAFHEKYAAVFEAVSAESQTNIPTNNKISSSQKKKRSKTMFKLLPLAAVLVIVLGSLTAQAFGLGSLFDMFSRWTSDLFHVSQDAVPHAVITRMPLEEGEEKSYESLQAAFDDFGVSARLAPRWVPERFELMQVKAVYRAMGIFITAEYVSDEGYLLIRYQEATENSRTYEIEGPEVTVCSYGKIDHYVMTNLEQSTVYWQNGELTCSVNGTVSQEEMTAIIQSIYEGE